MFHNNRFVKYKIFASTIVFKFQIKAESKDTEHRILNFSVQLSNLQKFVGVFDFFIFDNVFEIKNYWHGYLITCFYRQSLLLSNLVTTYSKLLRLRLHYKVFSWLV